MFREAASATHVAPVLAAAPRLQLPDVTLVAIDGRPQRFVIDMAQKALCYSMLGIDFGAVHLVTPQPPVHLDPRVEHRIGPILDGLGPYSRFIFSQLHRFVKTSHCLLVQADGFVVNPAAWRSDFLDYDYIGAPWPKTTAIRGGADYTIHDLSNQARVGNGGFSLRSHRLLAACADVDYAPFGSLPEDFVICRVMREYWLERGIRFAPLELAAGFACELPIDEVPLNLGQSFGFHGRHFEPEQLLMSF